LAQLNEPGAVSVDAQCNIYIADTRNTRIRKDDAATGVISTLATTAFVSPTAVLAASNGDVLYTGLDGRVTTLAADGSNSSSDSLGGPLWGLAFTQGAGSKLHVVETTTPAIWRFNNNNAGLGVSFADKPSALKSIVFDASDNAFIADQASGQIYKWDSNSAAAPAIWNTGDAAALPGADATAVRFNNPSGLAIDAAENMLVSESFAERVWLVEAATGKLRAVVGTGSPGRAVDAGSAAATQLRVPRGVGFGPGNTAYIADSLNNRILKVLLEC
jgi:hypothetical protein